MLNVRCFLILFHMVPRWVQGFKIAGTKTGSSSLADERQAGGGLAEQRRAKRIRRHGVGDWQQPSTVPIDAPRPVRFLPEQQIQPAQFAAPLVRLPDHRTDPAQPADREIAWLMARSIRASNPAGGSDWIDR